METFLGLPYWVWLIICLGIAIGYFVFVPAASNKPGISILEKFILRYAHSLVWIFLAIASVLANSKLLTTAKFVSLLSVPIYLAFIFTLLKSKIAKKKEKQSQ